jgi:uncharacterized membrane protein YphA (DoxX/SURF4 family)
MKTKILFVLCLLTGLLFINAGLNKFFNYLPVPEDMPEPTIKMFMAMMNIPWLMKLIAVAEIIGGLMFITNKFRTLGALILFPVLTGILLTNLTVDTSGLPMVIGLLFVFVWVVIENWKKYILLIK